MLPARSSPRSSIGTRPTESQSPDMAVAEGVESSLTGPESLSKLLRNEGYTKFGFILFRTFYCDESLWERFLDEYDSLLFAELKSKGFSDILGKVYMDIVSDDCMENKIPAHIAFVYRLFDDIERGLKTKMCLIVDKECMESVTIKDSQSVPFVKAVDVNLGEERDSAYPRVMKVAISSLLARFYPALANCDTVWEIATDIAADSDIIWTDWPDAN
ncbi:hypothetical protein BJX99DRAFT_238029 [Aspergillus californicus]